MKNPRIAITRALPDAERSAARLRELGAKPIVAPLLEIVPRAYSADMSGAQALLFTSANGVRAAQALRESALPVLAVGDATARTAIEAGFANVRSAKGDVAALAAMAAATLDPKAGALVHVSGADVAGDLVGALRRAGFDARRVVVYEARVVDALPEAYMQPLDMVAFHSARAARAFAGFGAPNAPQLIAACISPAVAAAASEAARWARVVVAAAPQEEALWRAALAA
jgi:uroporphyrinogen-III synthase